MTTDTVPILPDQGRDVTPNSSQVTLTENTPLLSSSCPSQPLITEVVTEENFSDPATYREHVVKEAKWIVSSSASASMTYFLQYFFSFVNVMSLGHLGTKELGAATLAIITSNVLSFAPAIGYACALDTFCTTAFTASADKRVVGFHLQRGLFSVIIHYCMVFPILWNIEWMLLLARQDPGVAHLCGKFMRVFVQFWPPTMDDVRMSVSSFLQAQGDMKTSTNLPDICGPRPRPKQPVLTHMVLHNWHWIPRISFGGLHHTLAHVPGPGRIHLIQQGSRSLGWV